MFRVSILTIFIVYSFSKVNGDCPDVEFICPHGDIYRMGQCYDWFSCEACRDNMVRNENTCNLGADCDETRWLARADGCSIPELVEAMGPEWLTGANGDVQEACDMHDLCYAAGVDQSQCDDDFETNIGRATGNWIKAATFANAVRWTDQSSNVEWGWKNCNPCPALNNDDSKGGRCASAAGGKRCNKGLRGYAVYCNSANGWCGDTNAHKDAQDEDIYDYQPNSCRYESVTGPDNNINNNDFEKFVYDGHDNNDKNNIHYLSKYPLSVTSIFAVLILLNVFCIIMYICNKTKNKNMNKYKTVSMTDSDTEIPLQK